MENQMKKSTRLPILAISLFSYNTQALETNPIYQQEPMVVTASRYQQLENDVIPSITVIDQKDILDLQANNIVDLLSLQQGIDVARSGGNGTATSIFMRGTNSNHTLVLIDGMRVGSSFTGSFSWEHIPVSQIERIEIVRGTRVSYYGSDAIGGVINIITRNQDATYFRYLGGSFNTHNFDLGFGGSGSKNQYNVSFSSHKTDGFSATNENNLFSFDPDDDGYENQSINFNAVTALTHGSLKINFLESHADTDFDTGNSDSKERVTRISWSGEVLNNWAAEVSFGNNYNELNTKTFSSYFSSQRNTLEAMLNRKINNSHMSFGLSLRNEKATFNNPNAAEVNFSDSRHNAAIFANLRTAINKNIFSFSSRYDANNVYGNNMTADVDWAYNISDKSRFNLSVGSAFHAPNINELFSPNFQGLVTSPITGESVFAFSFEGNPDLKPEESINYEAGFKANLTHKQELSFNLFYYKIDNLIDFQGDTFKPVNVNESTIKGLEMNYNYSLDSLSINVNATVQDANNDETDSPLLRRPDNKLNININKYYTKFTIGTSLRYASENPDFGVNLKGYTLINLRSSYLLNKNWRISAKIENVTNKKYQIINGYNTPELSGYISIEWQQ